MHWRESCHGNGHRGRKGLIETRRDIENAKKEKEGKREREREREKERDKEKLQVHLCLLSIQYNVSNEPSNG